MKILLLSFYYPPDLSAGSFRADALVEALLAKLPGGARLDVITTLPNRYASYSASAPAREQNGKLTLHRIALPRHRSGMLDQSHAFTAYARAAWRLAQSQQKYDLVIATSSRLMTATLGACIARRHSAKLYLDIRDIFVDTIKDVLSKRASPLAELALTPVERWTIARADKVNLVSPGFAGYFEPRFPAKSFSWFTNGIDQPFVSQPVIEGPSRTTGRLRVVYAGNIGAGQGLECILPALAEKTADRLDFVVLGDGGTRSSLERALASRRCTTVSVRSPVSRSELLQEYQAADVLFLHLNRLSALLRVLPSKLFEYAALGKPIWAGLAGYAAGFAQKEIANAAIFEPCDVDGALAAFQQLELSTKERNAFIERYTRTRIMDEMANDVLSLLEVCCRGHD